MKHSIEEMQFALALRALANGCQARAQPKPKNGDFGDEAFKVELAKWQTENPTISFIPAALDELGEWCDAVKQHLKT